MTELQLENWAEVCNAERMHEGLKTVETELTRLTGFEKFCPVNPVHPVIFLKRWVKSDVKIKASAIRWGSLLAPKS